MKTAGIEQPKRCTADRELMGRSPEQSLTTERPWNQFFCAVLRFRAVRCEVLRAALKIAALLTVTAVSYYLIETPLIMFGQTLAKHA